MIICFLEFLRDLSEILLYLLLPPDDFHNKILRLLARVSNYLYLYCDWVVMEFLPHDSHHAIKSCDMS